MLAEKIAINGLSVGATEALVKDETGANTKKCTGISTARSKQEMLVVHDPERDRLETESADSLGAYVEISHQTNGRCELVIRYASLDQLDGIITRMKR